MTKTRSKKKSEWSYVGFTNKPDSKNRIALTCVVKLLKKQYDGFTTYINARDEIKLVPFIRKELT